MKRSQISAHISEVIKNTYDVDIHIKLCPHFDFAHGHQFTACSQELGRLFKRPARDFAPVIASKIDLPGIKASAFQDFVNLSFSEEVIHNWYDDYNYQMTAAVYLPEINQCLDELAYLRLAACCYYQLKIAKLINVKCEIYTSNNSCADHNKFLTSLDCHKTSKLSSEEIYEKTKNFITDVKADTKLLWISTGILNAKDFRTLYAGCMHDQAVIFLQRKRWLYQSDFKLMKMNPSMAFYLASSLPAADLDFEVASLPESDNLPWFIESVLKRAELLLDFKVEDFELESKQKEILLRFKFINMYAEQALLGNVQFFDENLRNLVKSFMRYLNEPSLRIELAKGVTSRAKFLSYVACGLKQVNKVLFSELN